MKHHVALVVVAISFSAVHCGASVTPRDDASSATDTAGSDASLIDVPLEDAVTIDAGPAVDTTPIPGRCFLYDVDELIVPTVVLPGQSAGFTARTHAGASCGATPMIGGMLFSATLFACGGCEACNCVDPGYEASAIIPMPPVGMQTVYTGGLIMGPFVVAADGACTPLDTWTTGSLHIEVAGPDRTLRVASMPQLWWAHLTGTENRCCGEPLVGGQLLDVRPAGADLALALSECAPDPCECVGSPHPFDSWILLGELPPGMHAMSVAGMTVSFEVPAM